MSDDSSVTNPQSEAEIAPLINLLELLAELAVTEVQPESNSQTQPAKEPAHSITEPEPLRQEQALQRLSALITEPQPVKEQATPLPASSIAEPQPVKEQATPLPASSIAEPQPVSQEQRLSSPYLLKNSIKTDLDTRKSTKIELNQPSQSNFSQPESVALTSSDSNENWLDFEGNISHPLERIHDLLVDLYAPIKFDQIQAIETKIDSLENILLDSEQLTNLLVPLIGEVLSLRVASSKQEVIDAIVPIIDSAIERKSQHDRVAMSRALSTVIPGAITEQIQKNPEEIVTAFAPTMGKAISEQIRLERDSMVDALYPIIGNTISKYMGEAVREINRKVETTLSFEGVRRKIRAKLQGISEAELILREVLPSNVKAIFLIHKLSGLVISEVQKVEAEHLESDMLAGMLTAIRSFASECVIEPENTSELKEIQYDSFQIIMEVAGYCYIAVVCQGELSKPFLSQLRRTFASIVLYHGRVIEKFDGDPSIIPEAIPKYLEALIEADEKLHNPQQGNFSGLLILIAALIGISVGFGGWKFYQQWNANRVLSVLTGTPELAVYRLDAQVGWKQLKLTGKLPNQFLRQKAGNLAANTFPDWKIDNQIIAVKTPPDPILLAQEIKRLSILMNQISGVAIRVELKGDRIEVQGLVENAERVQQITQTFREFFTENPVIITLKTQKLPLYERFYFDSGSYQIDVKKNAKVIDAIANFLKAYPYQKLRIIGHTDSEGTLEENTKLSQVRAKVVKKALELRGIESQRLQTIGIPQPPTDIGLNQPTWMGRCVRFEQMTLETKDK